MKPRISREIMKSDSKLMDFLLSAYDQVIGDLPGIGRVENFAEKFVFPAKSSYYGIDRLIQTQAAKSASAGFLLNLGGLVTMPFTLPTDLASTWFLQMRTAAAIAHLFGKNIHSDPLKTLCILCLCGNGAQAVLQQASKKIGQELTKRAIQHISGEAIKAINKAVGFRLVTKFGHTGVINLSKFVPVVGGVVGGAFNGAGTYAVGRAAKYLFAK